MRIALAGGTSSGYLIRALRRLLLVEGIVSIKHITTGTWPNVETFPLLHGVSEDVETANNDDCSVQTHTSAFANIIHLPIFGFT